MLSISDALDSVILVGLLIMGWKECRCIKFMKSLNNLKTNKLLE
jgi:hypothetical protein